MVPVSLLLARSLQQWGHEDKTMQREKDIDGVRFTSITLRDGSKAVGEDERPHLQLPQALDVPQAVGNGAG